MGVDIRNQEPFDAFAHPVDHIAAAVSVTRQGIAGDVPVNSPLDTIVIRLHQAGDEIRIDEEVFQTIHQLRGTLRIGRQEVGSTMGSVWTRLIRLAAETGG